MHACIHPWWFSLTHISSKKWKKITKQRKVSPLTWWQYQLALGSTELQQGEGLLPKYTEKQWPTETSIDLSPYQYKIPPEIHSILTLSKDRIKFFSYFQSGPRSTNKTRGNSVSHPWFFFFEAKFQPWTTLIACSMQTKPLSPLSLGVHQKLWWILESSSLRGQALAVPVWRLGFGSQHSCKCWMNLVACLYV